MGDYPMRNLKGKLFLVTLVAVALTMTTVTFTTAGRKSTPVCQGRCNDLEQSCKNECVDERIACFAPCAELASVLSVWHDVQSRRPARFRCGPCVNVVRGRSPGNPLFAIQLITCRIESPPTDSTL